MAWLERGGVAGLHRKVHPLGRAVGRVTELCPGTRTWPRSTRRSAGRRCSSATTPGTRSLPWLAARDGAELLVVSAASAEPLPGERLDIAATWDDLLLGVARLLQVVVVFVNRSGDEAGLRYWGGSRVIDPWGTELARAGREEGVTVVEVESGAVAGARAEYDVAGDRRLDVVASVVARLKRTGLTSGRCCSVSPSGTRRIPTIRSIDHVLEAVDALFEPVAHAAARVRGVRQATLHALDDLDVLAVDLVPECEQRIDGPLAGGVEGRMRLLGHQQVRHLARVPRGRRPGEHQERVVRERVDRDRGEEPGKPGAHGVLVAEDRPSAGRPASRPRRCSPRSASCRSRRTCRVPATGSARTSGETLTSAGCTQGRW